ncbi:MAG: RES domain-containing protein [Gammaproteobacteria bacterium]|nr:RES domain-containing protein [Gammaproteobacteria bacterium]
MYRAHDPRWAWSALSGEGARRYGGRFNKPGIPTLYTSFTASGAVREVSPMGRRMQPLVLCAYEVDVAPVFDALDGADKDSLGIVDADLDCPAWRLEALSGRTPASQALVERLVSSGFAGMRVPSYAEGAGVGDVNLVLWRWGDALPHRVVLIDDEQRLEASLRRIRS